MTGSAAAAAVSALTGMPCRIISGERQEHLDGGGICDIKAVIWAQGKDGADPVNFYNQATKMTFTVSDEHLLRSAKLEDPDGLYNISESAASAEGKGSVTLTAELKDRTAAADGVFDRAITLTTEDLAGNVRTWTLDHTGAVTQDTTTTTQANATINGGKEYPEALVQDTVAPVVSLSGVTAGSYYNKPQSVLASVNEFNMDWLQRFDEGRAVVTVTKY